MFSLVPADFGLREGNDDESDDGLLLREPRISTSYMWRQRFSLENLIKFGWADHLFEARDNGSWAKIPKIWYLSTNISAYGAAACTQRNKHVSIDTKISLEANQHGPIVQLTAFGTIFSGLLLSEVLGRTGGWILEQEGVLGICCRFQRFGGPASMRWPIVFPRRIWRLALHCSSIFEVNRFSGGR